MQYNLGQLYIVVGQFDDGIKVLQDYIAGACGGVAPEAHLRALSGQPAAAQQPAASG